MTYDAIMITLIVAAIAGMVWASAGMEKARKAGKIRYIGKVRIDNEPK